MLAAVFEPLQASALSEALRASIWVYPLINVGHLLGIALLIGAIVPLDLRLLGLWRSQPVAPLARILIPVSLTGLALALACGLAMFISRPLDYAGASIFQAKIGLVVLAAGNALYLHRSRAWQQLLDSSPGGSPAGHSAGISADSSTDDGSGGLADKLISRPIMLAAAASLVLWIAALTLGRLLGFR